MDEQLVEAARPRQIPSSVYRSVPLQAHVPRASSELRRWTPPRLITPLVGAGQTADAARSAWTSESGRSAPVAFNRPDLAAVECVDEGVSLRIVLRWRCIDFRVG